MTVTNAQSYNKNIMFSEVPVTVINL